MEAMKGFDNAEVAVEMHRKRTDELRRRLKEAIEKEGHRADDELKMIDGKAVMVFILPSNENVYIGFGPTGARQAYRGLESGLDCKCAAKTISEYVHALSAGDARKPNAIVD